MTESVERPLVNDLDDQRLSLLRRKLAERGLLSQSAHSDDRRRPMSDGQRRMWFVHAVDPTGALLNVCVSYRLTGHVDGARLHGAVNAVAQRHPVLRTTYHSRPATGSRMPTVHADPDPRLGRARPDRIR